MKKLITLLLVLTGYVMSASAWTGIWFKGNTNGWGDGKTVYQFKKINDNSFIIYIDARAAEALTDDNKEIRFRFYVGDNINGQIGPDNVLNADVINYAYDAGKTSTQSTNYFYVPYSSTAKIIRINVDYYTNTEKWHVKAYHLTESDVESFKIRYNSSGINAYILGDGSTGNPFISKWPGISPDANNEYIIYTPTGNYEQKVIFNNNNNWESSQYVIVRNGLYNGGSGLEGITASISSVGYATFSSTKAVDFTSETTIEACKASVDGNGKITYTKVTSVAAGEGVLLRRADRTIAAASSVIPLNADQTIEKNAGNDLYGITAKQKIAQSTETGYTNFILAKPDKELGFFKVNDNGSWCAAGTAYLKVANGNIPTPVTSRGFFALDDETTGIEAVNNVSTESANDAREYYNLNGQRVMNPSKGLYIVNGKKVIIK